MSQTKHSKKIALIVIIIILLILILVGAVFLFMNQKLNLLGSGDHYSGEKNQKNTITISTGDNAGSSLNALLKDWAMCGGEMSSKDVTNILLIGCDSDSKLSDSMIVASVNRAGKVINLTSFYRDSYTYMNENGQEYYAKMNAAYINGGAPLVVRTIERDYKIKIDHYFYVDYNTFPKLIDALGGIDVKVTKKEANYLNKTWWRWTRTHHKIQFHSGTMHMNGEHALMFCRIRKLDSDVGRTARQRRVLNALMNRFKNASLSQLNQVANTVLPYVKTDMSKRQVMGLASTAISQGWSSYRTSQCTMPGEDTQAEGYVGNQWVWYVDYQGAAYDLQKIIYGRSNIILAKNRTTALNYVQTKPI